MTGIKRSQPDSLDAGTTNKRQRLEENTNALESIPASPSIYISNSPVPSSSAPTPNTAYSPPPQPLDNRTCPHCFKVFPRRPADLKKHLKVHITERSFACTEPDCRKTFRTEKDLKEHVSYNHLNEKGFTCSRAGCKAAFNTATRLRRHEQQVHESGIRCTRPGCGKRFRNTNTLNRHLREHDGLKPFPCKEPGCDESFLDNSALRRHLNREHKESDSWCMECDLHFRNAASLADHHRKTHSFPCSFCAETFSSQHSLEAHIDFLHNKPLEERKTVECPDCPKAFTRISNMNAHHRAAHQNLRYICGQEDVHSYQDLVEWDQSHGCGDSFTTKVKLVEHIRYRHLQQPRPRAPAPQVDVIDALIGPTINQMPAVFECDKPGCGHKFKRITDFEKHKARHKVVLPIEEIARPTQDLTPLDTQAPQSHPRLDNGHFPEGLDKSSPVNLNPLVTAMQEELAERSSFTEASSILPSQAKSPGVVQPGVLEESLFQSTGAIFSGTHRATEKTAQGLSFDGSIGPSGAPSHYPDPEQPQVADMFIEGFGLIDPQLFSAEDPTKSR